MSKPAKPDKAVELPSFGVRIPSERFHVSELNMRAKEPFGQSERDKQLIENLRRGEVIQPFKARPEGNGYGVYVGRRRLLGKCAVGVKAFVVGKDVLIENIADERAREESYIENLDVLREETNPLLRARATQNLIDSNMAGLRAVARKLGLAPSTLSEWTKILELTPPMQKAVEKGQIFYKDALTLTKLKAGEVAEERLAEVLETGGRDAYVAEVQKLETGRGKRGRPIGKYVGVHVLYEVAHEMKDYEDLGKLAAAKNMTIEEYGKQVWKEHIKSLL
jgi:ParB family chromosome partitioning protein